MSERCVGATIRRYVIAVLSGMRGACMVCVCVVPPCWWVPCAGVSCLFARVRLTSPACAWTSALAVVNDAYESIMSKRCKRLHHGLEEGGLVGPRGGVGLGVSDFSSGSSLLDLGSCGGQGMC